QIDHHFPVFCIDAHGSLGGSGFPLCNSSIECLSGERTNAMLPSRGPVDSDTAFHQPSVNIVDFEGQVAKKPRFAAHLFASELAAKEIERLVEIANPQHSMQISHAIVLLLQVLLVPAVLHLEFPMISNTWAV